MTEKQYSMLSIGLVAGVILLGAGLTVILRQHHAITGVFDEKGWVAYSLLGGLELLCSASIFFPMPADPIVVLAATKLQPLAVGLVAGFAASLGEFSAYAAGFFGLHFIWKGEKTGKKIQKGHDLLEKYGFVVLPVFAFVPLSVDVLGIVCGSLRYEKRKFFLGILIGKTAKTVLLSYAGAWGIHAVLRFFPI